MSLTTIILSALFFVALGLAYVKGYDAVKKRAPHMLTQYYLLTTLVRMVLVMVVVLAYILTTDNKSDKVMFSAMFLGMYVVMMVVTLKLKH